VAASDERKGAHFVEFTESETLLARIFCNFWCSSLQIEAESMRKELVWPSSFYIKQAGYEGKRRQRVCAWAVARFNKCTLSLTNQMLTAPSNGKILSVAFLIP